MGSSCCSRTAEGRGRKCRSSSSNITQQSSSILAAAAAVAALQQIMSSNITQQSSSSTFKSKGKWEKVGSSNSSADEGRQRIHLSSTAPSTHPP